MWFKNAFVFHFEETFDLDAETIDEMLQAHLMDECPKTKEHHFGWLSPYGKDHPVMVHACGPYYLICLGKQERLLPAAVVRDHLDTKIAEIEMSQERRVYGKEKALLRDEITFDLLPKSFIKNKKIWAFIDTKSQRLVIDTASENRANEFTDCFREIFDSVTLHIHDPEKDLAQEMTNWVRSEIAPAGFSLANDCVMEDNEKEVGNVRVSGQDITAADIVALLKTHRRVEKLGLVWQDRIEFQLNKNGVLSRIKYTDIVKDQNADAEIDSKAAQMDSDFAIMSYELVELLDALDTLSA